MKRNDIVLMIFGIVIVLCVFKNVIVNINSGLISWLDYPYIIWVQQNQMDKIVHLDWMNIFETNAFYPNKLSIFFSDVLVPQSIIGFMFSLFTNNPITVFNLTFLLTFVLNFLSAFTLWKRIFNQSSMAWLGGLLTVFSPFFYIQQGHFQMQTIWPFLFGLNYLLKQTKSTKDSLIIGTMLGIQFLASVYLSVFFATVIAIYFFISYWQVSKRALLKDAFLICLTFILSAGIYLYGYSRFNKTYHPKRDYGEFVTYSAHITDYIFSGSINSGLHSSSILRKWNSFDKHWVGEKASFPGFMVLITAVLGIFTVKKGKENRIFGVELNREVVFFLALIIVGILFSLGPRLSFNGDYSGIPSVYDLILKTLGPLKSIRAVSRWSFLFYIGMIYFSLKYINIIRSKFGIIVFGLFGFWAIFEYSPINLRVSKSEYLTNDYILARNICKDVPKVMLEIPYVHYSEINGTIIDGLEYISKMELASVFHKCRLINGYSGYEPEGQLKIFKTFRKFVDNGEWENYYNELKSLKVTLVKMNRNKLDKNLIEKYDKLIEDMLEKGYIKKQGESIYLVL